MNYIESILAKNEKGIQVSLIDHLTNVSEVAKKIAFNLNLDYNIAYKGAILHDIGKASPLFQNSIQEGYIRPPGLIFRHEIASIFFISLLKEDEKYPIIDMIIAHHKSIYKDIKGYGILDLEENIPDCFQRHSKYFTQWSEDALQILSLFGFDIKNGISLEQAKENYNEVVEYCDNKKYGYSIWKGVLMASDYFASALNNKTDDLLNKVFVKPNLKYYESRQSQIYPLSLISAQEAKPHTLVTAPTGAGKTDFLMRRCRGRVFYILPFQASINAMYKRFKNDLKDTDADIRLLHATSSIVTENTTIEEKILQRHIGASIKVLTPHQLSALVFGVKGYETLLVDLKNCDVILDEIHTYSGSIQSIVLKIVEILYSIGCRIHIGTATMPSVLYENLLNIMGGPTTVCEVKLDDITLNTFDRHITYKSETIDELIDKVENAVNKNQKILFVCNKVLTSQQLYRRMQDIFPEVKKLLIHSRFKRIDRNKLENKLYEYDRTNEACIVISTQVVEVSLDISFDLLITECAPIDSLIQRFGRINRKRSKDTIGHFKPVYVLQPPDDLKEAKPYDLKVLKNTYAVINEETLMKEKDMQKLIDKVYPSIEPIDIDLNTVFKDGQWKIKELWHNNKSALLDALDIDSIACITEDEKELYEKSNYTEQSKMEIPVSYKSIGFRNLDKLSIGSLPFVIPSKAYSQELGLLLDHAYCEFYDITNQFL